MDNLLHHRTSGKTVTKLHSCIPTQLARVVYTIAGLTLTAAGVHLAVSIRARNGQDTIFVVLILANTLLMLHWIRAIHSLAAQVTGVLRVREAFKMKSMAVFGCIYGAAFGLYPILAAPHLDTPLVISLTTFLAIHNVLTGMCILAVIRCYHQLLKNDSALKVTLWDRANDELELRSKAIRTTVLHITCISSVAFTSVLFSYLNITIEIWGFSAFCAVLVIVAYVMPEYSITRKLWEVRRKKLEEIDRMIQKEFDRQVATSSNPAGEDALSRLRNLQYLRKMTAEVRCSMGLMLLSKTRSIFGLILVSAIPIFVDLACKGVTH